MSLSVPEGPANSNDLAGGGSREVCDREESLAIPMANLDDFNFGDSNHRRLCRAIVAGEVEPQWQTHFRAFFGAVGAILGRT